MTGRRGRVAGVLLVAALALLATACGDDPGDRACGLVTEAEADRILGTPVREPEVDDESLGPGSSCAWISRDSTRDPEAAVYGFFVSVRDDAEGRREFTRRSTRPGDGFTSVPVDGLGDAAYSVEDETGRRFDGTPSLPVLTVRAGDDVLLVGTFDSDEHPVDVDAARRMQRAVARAAVARL